METALKANKHEGSPAVANATAQQKSKVKSTPELLDKRADKNAQKQLGTFISNSPKLAEQRVLNKQISGQMNSSDGVIQGAWIGRRGLAHSEWLKWGITKEHARGRGVFHEHIFYEDGRRPANQGFGPNGIFTEGEEGYEEVGYGYDDGAMRLASQAHQNTGKYNLFRNNCQQWVSRVLRTYFRIKHERPRRKVTEEEGIEMRELGGVGRLDISRLPPGEYEMKEL